MTLWDEYYNRPVEQIPWNSTQADFFQHLIDNNVFKGSTVLDLGCGTGKRSVVLAKNGFGRVVGVDIASRAISYAQENAQKDAVRDVCEFVSDDSISWLGKNEEMFDIVLDWAHIHCLARENVSGYARLVQEHVALGGLFLVRAFCSKSGDQYFEDRVGDESSRVACYTKQELQDLFPDMRIVQEHTSYPKHKSELFFNELLMKKI